MNSKLSKRRIQSFKQNRKAYGSFLLLSFCFLLSLFGELLCNDRPLLVSYQGHVYIPFLRTYPASQFGESYETEAHYRERALIENIEREGWILWAPIRFGPASVDQELTQLAPSPPDSQHLLGTDDRGRDVFARLLFGFRLSLVFGILVASIGALLGTFFGALQAYQGSKVDLLGQRLTEIWSSMPELFILMILNSLFRPSFYLLLCFMCMMGWMTFATYARGEFLRLAQLDFVKSAQGLGASKLHVIFQHMLPHALAPIISYFPIRVSTIIASLASLDFLSLGLPSSSPSLGELLLQASAHLHCWWLMLSTVLTLCLTLILLNFISEGIRQALDPKGG